MVSFVFALKQLKALGIRNGLITRLANGVFGQITTSLLGQFGAT